MNTVVRAIPTRPEPHACAVERRSAAPAPSNRRIHRTRDFGVGYGSSSGYASEKRYTPAWSNPRFRFG